jgi:hypothetical protein
LLAPGFPSSKFYWRHTAISQLAAAGALLIFEFTTISFSANPAPPSTAEISMGATLTYYRRRATCTHAPVSKAGKMIRKLASGEFRLYSRKKNPKTGKRRNLGTFKTRAAAERHEREIHYFKRQA